MTDRRIVMLGLMAGMSGLAAASRTAPAAASVSESDAQAAIDSFLDALFSGDPAKADRVLAPEFQILRSDGKSYDKMSYLGALPNHKVRPAISSLKSTGHGGIIVTSYSITTEQTIGGQPVEAVAPRLSVFRKEGDRWLIVAHANFAQIG
ncbi:nuclear transport factor 2 family protein [Aquibium sp. ELW1220]|uniref:nuclear transport factor 2 family protein n=1 Tax=Aquibium sp. ELW1220 TaxID=2976766 RepID=UPI0025B177B1|nr:nuclear transport factor 2 family protein [Aquibium sp. ELW1220]MDN2582979.1 nuclear transport factor 2 family protein [Aquibium sp. ELW1220]